MNIQDRDMEETNSVGQMADRKVYGFVAPEVFRAFIGRLKREGIIDQEGRADIGWAVRMLVTQYAQGAIIQRPAPRRLSTGADYLGVRA